MKLIYFGVIFFLCCKSTYGVNSTDVQGKRRSVFDIPSNIVHVIGDLTGISGLKSDLWDLVESFDTCEVRCIGKTCSCCQRMNFLLMKVKVCMNSYFYPSQRAMKIAIAVGETELGGIQFAVAKMQSICQTFGIRPLKAELCIHPIVKDYSNDGLSLCATAELVMQQIKIVQVNLNCLNYDGEISLAGQRYDDGRTIASLRVLNPVQFVKLWKRIIFGYNK